MRIAIIGSKGIPARAGGIERHVEELAPRLAKRGFRVTVYTRPWYTGTRKTSHGNVRLVPLASIKTKHLDAITHTLLATLHAMKERFDIYHYHGVGPALLAWIPRVFRPSAKVIVTFHCLDRRVEKWGALARTVLKFGEWAATHFAHKTIVVSKSLAHYCREVYDCAAVYIPNGVKVSKPLIKDNAVLEKLGLSKGRYVVMVSRLIRSKNADTLVDAWKRLKATATDLRVLGMKLVIVGDGDANDPYVWEVRAKAAGSKDIVLAGARYAGELHALIAGSAFAVHPSASEGLPIAVLEKMAHGKAVLTSNIPEHLEIVEGRGFTFRLEDTRDLMLQLYWMLTHPRACADMGREAKKHVASYFNWEKIAKETSLVYTTLAQKPAKKSVRKAAFPLAGARRVSAA
ncbi:MAG: glycosyltransferase family 4 protein [Patescibacteria group bacterium]|nr:MAG: glycosyltransferase family 4 protein [Patescibacteria group bacterium]